MEENENQQPFSNYDNFSENGKKKKKGMGPLKGLLLAILIVFLICVIGLLIRMVVSGDGDYFKPIKEIFGIEGEEKEEKKSSNKVNKNDEDKEDEEADYSGMAERYTLLSDDVEDEDVKHYRMTIDIKDVLEYALDNSEDMDDLFTKTTDLKFNKTTNVDFDNYNFDDENDDDNYYDDYSYDTDEDYQDDSDYYDDDYDYGYDTDEDYQDDSDYGYDTGLNSSMESAMMMLEQLKDVLAGEMYVDVYFDENELVQVVVGFDYSELLENLYDMLTEDEDSVEAMKDDGVESLEDLADYMVEQFEENFDKDAIYERLIEDEDVKDSLSTAGITEKDIKAAFDTVNDKGLVEFYITGTTKLKGLISMYLDSDEFRDELETVQDETDFEIDEDNLIESLLLMCNETEEYQELGFEFEEVED